MVIKGKFVKLKLPTPCDGLALVALHGTGTQGGKQRIVKFFAEEHTAAERTNFVKSECMNYGFGSPTRKPNYLFSVDFFRGVNYSYCDEFGREYKGCTATWKQLANKIQELIDKGTYINGGGGGFVSE